VLLDGTWSQAKALWWRNAWMLKCQRVILGPSRPSRYGQLRREPRRDGLSTIEAGGDAAFDPREARGYRRRRWTPVSRRMLARYRKAQHVLPELVPQTEAESGTTAAVNEADQAFSGEVDTGFA